MQRLTRATVSVPLLIAVAVLWISLLAVPHLQARATLLDPVESWLLDLRYRLAGPRAAAPDIVFVAIDDTTLEAGQAGPVGRARLTRLIGNIADSGARTLVVDVLLADAGDTAEREALAAALARMPTVIAAAARLEETGVANVIWPHSAFQAQAEVGLVNLSTDAGGTPRYMPLFLTAEGAPLPSLPLLAAISLTGAQARIDDRNLSLGEHVIPLDAAANMPLRLLGPAGTVPTISASEVLSADRHKALTGKLVVLGFSASAMGDRFVTPFDDDTPGAEIIASAISQLVGGETLRRDGQVRAWDVGHAALLTLLSLALMLRMPVLQALPLALVLLLISFGAVTLLFAQGLWMHAALPLAAAIPPLIIAGTVSLIRERQKARQSDQSLASLRRFQSPALARRIENNPDYLSTPLAQDLVIFFVDLTGFTSLSQKLGPDGTRALLQRFHGVTADAVEARNGSVINYMGDGALAVFGLEPGADEHSDADEALAAAQDLEKSLATVDPAPDTPSLACRIGLHHGPVILSRLGADTHQQVSVSGDTVNLASRLLELAKSEQARIVATREFITRLSPDTPLLGTRQTDIAVRGRSGDVNVVVWPLT